MLLSVADLHLDFCMMLRNVCICLTIAWLAVRWSLIEVHCDAQIGELEHRIGSAAAQLLTLTVGLNGQAVAKVFQARASVQLPGDLPDAPIDCAPDDAASVAKATAVPADPVNNGSTAAAPTRGSRTGSASSPQRRLLRLNIPPPGGTGAAVGNQQPVSAGSKSDLLLAVHS